jgi:tripartite-type tricarboxylate transporter receptor subunit TctC
MRRRELLLMGLSAAVLPDPNLLALAQEQYPSRPIRLVIPSVPAGVHDVIGRLWAERVKPVLGTIVIDNRGGGGGVIGANDVAHAQPDGYSILLGSTSTQVLSPAAMAQPPYDPVKSFAGVSVFSFRSTSIVVTRRCRCIRLAN